MTVPTLPAPHALRAIRTPLRIAVVDDHPLYREGVVRTLEAAGETVVGEASDGTTALTLIRRHRPDVALVDVRMPGMDGIDVTDDLARNGPSVPVVLLSAFDDGALVRRGLEAGAVAFVTKDADRDEILRALRAAAAATQKPDEMEPFTDVVMNRLTDDERWLLRLADAGLLDRSDMAEQTGLSNAEVIAVLTGAIDRLGASNLPDALLLAHHMGLLGASPPRGDSGDHD